MVADVIPRHLYASMHTVSIRGPNKTVCVKDSELPHKIPFVVDNNKIIKHYILNVTSVTTVVQNSALLIGYKLSLIHI